MKQLEDNSGVYLLTLMTACIAIKNGEVELQRRRLEGRSRSKCIGHEKNVKSAPLYIARYATNKVSNAVL